MTDIAQQDKAKQKLDKVQICDTFATGFSQMLGDTEGSSDGGTVQRALVYTLCVRS